MDAFPLVNTCKWRRLPFSIQFWMHALPIKTPQKKATAVILEQQCFGAFGRHPPFAAQATTLLSVVAQTEAEGDSGHRLLVARLMGLGLRRRMPHHTQSLQWDFDIVPHTCLPMSVCSWYWRGLLCKAGSSIQCNAFHR